MTDPLTPTAVQDAFALDDATMARLDTHIALLVSWQARLNLVGPSTLADPWRRHVLDSLQILRHLPKKPRNLTDLGSGAGFPGLVLAIAGVPNVRLVEATAKKCRFLEAVAEATSTDVTIANARIETLPPQPSHILTARALAPLPKLLGFAHRLIGPPTRCLFLKGASVERELTDVAPEWRMDVTRHPSLTHPDGVLLELRDVRARAGT